MTEHDKLISTQKEYLPMKAKKHDYPHIVWIEAPEHVNFNNNLLRSKFNRSLHTAASFHDNCHVLELKKIWDGKDRTLYLSPESRFTADGYNCYWEAVDKTGKFADTILFKKLEKKKLKENCAPDVVQPQLTAFAGKKKQNYHHGDRYHSVNHNHNGRYPKDVCHNRHFYS